MRRELAGSEVAIKRGGVVVDRVDDDRAGPKLSPAPDAPPQSIDEEVTSETVAVFGLVERESSEHDDRNRIWHPPPDAGRCRLMPYGAHRERVVAHDSVTSAEDVGGGCPCGGRGACRVAQPAVKGGDTAVEALDAMPVGQQFDRTQVRAAQRAGMGLRFRA